VIWCAQFLVPALQKRKAPLCLTLHCNDLIAVTEERLRGLCSGMRVITFGTSAPAKDTHAQDVYDGAWSAAALIIAFVRANYAHPFVLSVVPLIPSILTLTDRRAKRMRGFHKKASVLLSSAFAQSHFGRRPAPALTLIGNAATHNGDGDGDGAMTDAPHTRKRHR
jgi:hypothetical protein